MASRLYKLSLLALGAVTAVLLGMTIAHATREDVFAGPLTVVLLVCVCLLTALCLCLEQPRGGRVYKVGFYLLHGGVVLLLVGFLLSHFLAASYNVALPVGGASYTEVQGEDGVVPLGFSLSVTNAVTEYYEDENGNPTENPRHYEATLSVDDGSGARELSLTVNHPLRVRGNKNYKIYLMSFGSDPATGRNAAYLLLKSDPAEFPILAGIVVLLAGTVLCCLIAPIFSRGGDLPEASGKSGKKGGRK